MIRHGGVSPAAGNSGGMPAPSTRPRPNARSPSAWWSPGPGRPAGASSAPAARPAGRGRQGPGPRWRPPPTGPPSTTTRCAPGSTARATRSRRPPRPGPRPTFDGQLYGQPLVYGGRVFAATENDTVYALAADSGQVLWSSHLGTPFTKASVPGICGNITPTVGITGTPVIDPSRSEIFVVATEAATLNGSPNAAHHLIGLNTYTGLVMLDEVIDPAGTNPAYQLQRVSLGLTQGRVVVGFGGNSGDCGPYHGLVVSAPEDGSAPSVFTVANQPGDSQGAVWMGGAAPSDRRPGQRLGGHRQQRPPLVGRRLRPERQRAQAQPDHAAARTPSPRPTGTPTTPPTSIWARVPRPSCPTGWSSRWASRRPPTCSTSPAWAASAARWPQPPASASPTAARPISTAPCSSRAATVSTRSR